MPAISPYIFEPIWEQFRALLPERKVDHPLGCHRRRIPDQLVFEKLLQILVFGCAYWRIADESCSATTLRRRRDEWIEAGVMDNLEEMARQAYDRTIGLDVADVAVDCCITKAPCGGEKAGRSPVDRGKQGIKRSVAVDADGIPLGFATAPANRHDSPLLGETMDSMEEILGALPEPVRVHLDRGYDSDLTRKRLEERDLLGVISEKGEVGTATSDEPLGGRAHQLLAKRAQKARVVHRAAGTGHRLLDRLFQRDRHRREARPKSVGSLPLGGTSPSPPMTYWRGLLIGFSQVRIATVQLL